MPEAFLLSRILLKFDPETQERVGDLSAVAFTPDGSLWVGSDELLTLERLSLIEPYVYGNHQPFEIGEFIELFNQEDEIDIEGMDYSEGYLWFTGSHSTKRNKPKGKNPEKDISRLAEIKTDANRYLLARIPIQQGIPVQACSDSLNGDRQLTAASLQKTETGNILIDALKKDIHFGSIIAAQVPSKENGLDIEGLAVRGSKILIGFRGPVLRGWSVIIELEVEESEPGILTLKEIGAEGRLYKKHFLDLNGLGIRELCLEGDDLIVLAGPTLDLDGGMKIFRLTGVFERQGDTIIAQDETSLKVLFDLPFKLGTDRGEGLALLPCLGQPNSLLVVYDSPDPERLVNSDSVFGDVFRL
ncbi:DUF3616 domain-containing protein [Phormidium pseudopriestleyi FRX01]|uniref:DUF3616 domain-containing protein n=1 Tax=Phormidium pseudopriestleyi FRX01 TaxID=1759528 RepID=A0ABS3FWP2_9CYAN|nr:DUF3616 domain-containing protein [Phormidium pseudopriestleyi]MBO0351505.1 DUF3616 domain-containing protein [Phormidium pseudopriestleyi FRX01]